MILAYVVESIRMLLCRANLLARTKNLGALYLGTSCDGLGISYETAIEACACVHEIDHEIEKDLKT